MAKPDFTKLLEWNPDLKIIKNPRQFNQYFQAFHVVSNSIWFPKNRPLLNMNEIASETYTVVEGEMTFIMPYKDKEDETNT